MAKPVSTTRSRVPSPSATSVNSTRVEFPSTGSTPPGSLNGAHRNANVPGLVHALDSAAARAVLLPAQLELAALAQVDVGSGVPEPLPEMLGLGYQRPHALHWRVDYNVALDPVVGHRFLLR